MQAKEPLHELRIGPLVNKRCQFPYFIKGVPPKWKNAPPSVKLFKPFDDLKFRLELEFRLLDSRRSKSK